MASRGVSRINRAVIDGDGGTNDSLEITAESTALAVDVGDGSDRILSISKDATYGAGRIDFDRPGGGGEGYITRSASAILIKGIGLAMDKETASALLRLNYSSGLTASTTQTQAAATETTAQICEIGTVANADDAVKLGSQTDGTFHVVINRGANQMTLYPASGYDIGAGTNLPITVAADAVCLVFNMDVTADAAASIVVSLQTS